MAKKSAYFGTRSFAREAKEIARRHAAERKPAPDIFLEAARRIVVPPRRCIVVEDAPAGLEGARRAGMRSVGVLSEHHPRLEADTVVTTLTALPPDAIRSLLDP